MTNVINIKTHSFTNLNIIDPRIDLNLKEKYPNGIDLCYTDPPWGNGNLSYWKTINKKMTGSDSDLISQEELEDRIVQLICGNVKKYAFIIYGVREAESLMKKFKGNNRVSNIQYIEKKYKSGSKWLKNCLIVITFSGNDVLDFSNLKDSDGISCLKYVLGYFKNSSKSILELFIGVGFYLKYFDSYGYDVIGNELNLGRLTTAVSKINK
jgi:hypothetical protein